MDRALLDRALTDTAQVRPLPDNVAALLRELSAPPRLAAHLRAVHEVAWQLTEAITAMYPMLPFDREEVLFGAATHDIGKTIHPTELSQPGTLHEQAGYELLIQSGVEHRLARFAANHGTWTTPGISTEDLLVSLADKIWKAKRVSDLDDRIIQRICDISSDSRWQVFMNLDDLLHRIAQGADTRLAFQNQYRSPTPLAAILGATRLTTTRQGPAKVTSDGPDAPGWFFDLVSPEVDRRRAALERHRATLEASHEAQQWINRVWAQAGTPDPQEAHLEAEMDQAHAAKRDADALTSFAPIDAWSADWLSTPAGMPNMRRAQCCFWNGNAISTGMAGGRPLVPVAVGHQGKRARPIHPGRRIGQLAAVQSGLARSPPSLANTDARLDVRAGGPRGRLARTEEQVAPATECPRSVGALAHGVRTARSGSTWTLRKTPHLATLGQHGE